MHIHKLLQSLPDITSAPTCVCCFQAREPGDGKARGAIRAIADARQLRDENSLLQQQLQEQQGMSADLNRATDELHEREEQLQAVSPVL